MMKKPLKSVILMFFFGMKTLASLALSDIPQGPMGTSPLLNITVNFSSSIKEIFHRLLTIGVQGENSSQSGGRHKQFKHTREI